MNVNFFSARISYLKDANGKMKKVVENYLVNGWRFGSVEERIEKELKDECLEYFQVDDISKVNYEEYVPNALLEEPKYYTIKTTCTYIDDKGKEVKQKHYYLVASDSTENATELFKEYMKDNCDNWEICGIIETNYLEIFMES